MNQMRKQQSGFTLVEIAIVLVIIGLLLGGVLKGQELINSAKVKNMVGDFRTVSSLAYGYQDRFKALPGDQTQAQLDLAFGAGVAAACAPPAAAGQCVQNNGRIDGTWNAGAATDETNVFWQHVRLANLAIGPTALGPNLQPRNADGGLIGIESGLNAAGAAAPFIALMRGTFFVCSDGILGRYVRQIDTVMDDGDTAAGSVQAVPTGSARATAATATAAIQDGAQYTVCASF
ncbi:MAG: prepilin-type N-terminal cleavage/methylation domain-containing protein [Candidatus Accumulibacter propinquus]|jgi:prepilin-type N-terminal cleavage/methylation domain-containing protein|uniref:prepilin-type N-terminal cleavage/methylation domain-containing protein n=1 Tax=Candidatus Accumulibacter propinquus TaxID=2954380 RepID=UPI002FC3C7A8